MTTTRIRPSTFDARTAKVFSTGQLARVCNVAPRTVAKWFDAGLIRGYRIPGSLDRRVTRAEVVRFLRDSGMTPIPSNYVLLVGVDERTHQALADSLDGLEVAAASNVFRAGAMCAANPPAVAVVDASVGREAFAAATYGLAAANAKVVALVAEDWPDTCPVGCDAHFRRPFDPELLSETLTTLASAE